MARDAAGGVGVGVVAPAVGGVLPRGPPYIVCMARRRVSYGVSMDTYISTGCVVHVHTHMRNHIMQGVHGQGQIRIMDHIHIRRDAQMMHRHPHILGTYHQRDSGRHTVCVSGTLV